MVKSLHQKLMICLLPQFCTSANSAHLPQPSAKLYAVVKRHQSFSNVRWLYNSRRWRCHMQQGARNMVLPTPVVSGEGNVANSSSASNRLHLQHTQTCVCVRHSRTHSSTLCAYKGTEDCICHPHLLQEFIIKTAPRWATVFCLFLLSF